VRVVVGHTDKQRGSIGHEIVGNIADTLSKQAACVLAPFPSKRDLHVRTEV
jgi:hypothetical protein